MSCNFLLISAAGYARVVAAHPTPAAISDALDGAVPTLIYFGRPGGCAWVRETCATEGSPRNPVASILARTMGAPGYEPFTGPVAFTALAWAVTGGYATAVAEGFSDQVAERLVEVCGDLRAAVDGVTGGFRQEGLDAAWAETVRAAAEVAEETPIPDGWPHCAGINQPDPVADMLRRAGLGRVFAPLPLRM
jgi:hypothetical protein